MDRASNWNRLALNSIYLDGIGTIGIIGIIGIIQSRIHFVSIGSTVSKGRSDKVWQHGHEPVQEKCKT